MNWRAEENLLVNNKDNRVFGLGTIGLIVAPWKFDVLKTSIFALEASTETLYCLNSLRYNVISEFKFSLKSRGSYVFISEETIKAAWKFFKFCVILYILFQNGGPAAKFKVKQSLAQFRNKLRKTILMNCY